MSSSLRPVRSCLSAGRAPEHSDVRPSPSAAGRSYAEASLACRRARGNTQNVGWGKERGGRRNGDQRL
eukprot:1182632-Pyramimonas_sp.AAC.1